MNLGQEGLISVSTPLFGFEQYGRTEGRKGVSAAPVFAAPVALLLRVKIQQVLALGRFRAMVPHLVAMMDLIFFSSHEQYVLKELLSVNNFIY